MDGLLVIARLLLALLFAVAGLAKLADLSGSRRSLREFGVAASLTAPLAIVLPLLELTVAVALSSATYAWWGAVGALVLLLVFILAIGVNLARGRAPDCRCFGQLSSGTAGLAPLVRNEMLAAVAGLLIWQGWNSTGPGVLTWLSELTTGQQVRLFAGLALFGLTANVEGVWRRLRGGRPWKSPQVATGGRGFAAFAVPAATEAGSSVVAAAGQPVGAPAPIFDLPLQNEERLSLEALLAGRRPVMLIFVGPDCDPCESLLPEIANWQSWYADDVTISVISSGDPQMPRAGGTVSGVINAPPRRDADVAGAYMVVGLPAAVTVRPDGVISSRLALGAEPIRALLARTLAAQAAAPKASSAATAGTVATTAGEATALSRCRPCGQQ